MFSSLFVFASYSAATEVADYNYATGTHESFTPCRQGGRHLPPTGTFSIRASQCFGYKHCIKFYLVPCYAPVEVTYY